MRSKNVAFLLGSGVSLPFQEKPANARYNPISTQGITESLLEDRWCKTGPWLFEKGNTQKSFEHGCDEQKFIYLLYNQVSDVLLAREGHLPNYEDLYEYLVQIDQHASGKNTNPLIANTVLNLQNASINFPPSYHTNNPFAALAGNAIKLIEKAILQTLLPLTPVLGTQHPKPLDDHLRLIVDASRYFGNIDVFTLNHDLVLEEYLRQTDIGCCDGFGFLQQNRVDYCDGFSHWDGDIARFRFNNLFDSWCSAKEPFCRLIKLHGSINWFRERGNAYEFSISDRYIKVMPGKRNGRGRDCIRDGTGNCVDYYEYDPVLLSGTVEKEKEYGRGIFGAMFWKFRERLYHCDTLICGGYGWLDYGVNVCVDEWLNSAPEHRLIILHDMQKDDLRKKRFWEDVWDPEDKWTSYEKAEKLIHVNKWLCNCTWSDIQQYFIPCNGCRVQTQTCAAAAIEGKV